MTYIRYIPSPPLNTYIYHLYYLDNPMLYPHERILPLPMLDLKINLGGALQVYEADHRECFATFDESWCVGVWSVPHMVDWPLDIRLFGVAFKPEGASPFLQIPLSDLHNRVVSLDELWRHSAPEIRESLYAAPTIEAGFTILERWLLAHLCEAPHGLGIIQHAITQIAQHHGTVSIRELSDNIGISQNHLNTQFKRMVGIRPKELARLYRFQDVLRSIDLTQPVDWTLVAHQSHYYDISHLNKDFVAFTAHNPTDYLRLRKQVYAANPEHAQFLRNLPID